MGFLGKQAAGVLASWMGGKSAWRGSHFPAYYDQLPGEGHFVVFVTNDERPSFLKDFPTVDGPQISIMDAPYSLYAKMLVWRAVIRRIYLSLRRRWQAAIA